ncbi:MAG: metallophosphoesterase [Planctomycetota bacterium]
MWNVIAHGIPALTVVWWLWADRRMARTGRGRPLGRRLLAIVLRGAVASVAGVAALGWLVIARGEWAEAQFHLSGPVLLDRWAQAAAMTWGFLILPWALVLMAVDVAAGVFVWLRGKKTRAQANRSDKDERDGEPPVHGASRRDVLRAGLAGAPVLAAAGATGASLRQLAGFRAEPLDVPVPGLPIALDGLTITHLTDVHVGRLTRGKVLDRIVDACAQFDSDAVVLTGDLVNYHKQDLDLAVVMLRRIAEQGRPVICVEGNHDLFIGEGATPRERWEDGRRLFHKTMRDAGLPLLWNEARTWTLRGHPVCFVGLQWCNFDARYPSFNRWLVEAVVDRAEPGAFPILLSHHPDAFDVAAERGVPLTLAGHTHGGQLMVGEVGGGPAMFRYWSGLYRKGDARLVVSNGVGNWFPLRVGAPAELRQLVLRPEAPAAAFHRA